MARRLLTTSSAEKSMNPGRTKKSLQDEVGESQVMASRMCGGVAYTLYILVGESVPLTEQLVSGQTVRLIAIAVHAVVVIETLVRHFWPTIAAKDVMIYTIE